MSTKAENDTSPDDLAFSVTLNIEGRTFCTSHSTTTSIPGSLLASLDQGSKYFNKATNVYCFDRDSNLFPHILAAHRDGEVHVPQDVCSIRFRRELEFWRIPISLIAPCCWNYYYKTYEDLETLNAIVNTLPKPTSLGSDKVMHILNQHIEGKEVALLEKANEKQNETWRMKMWLFLDEPRSSTAALVWCWVFVFIATISVILNIIWLEEALRVDPYLAPVQLQGNVTFNDKLSRLVLTDPHIVMLILDCFCTLFFFLEMIAHFSLCPNKRRFFLDYYCFVKTFLALCMVYSTVFELRKDWLTTDTIGFIWFVVKSMNTLRVLLIFKLCKVSPTLNVVFLSTMSCTKELGLLLLVLLFMVIIYGGLIFAFEIDTEMFPNIMSAMWWALITMTTIGYGDFHPTKAMGYAVGTSCAIEGVMVIALPIAVIASQFGKFKDRSDDLQKHLEVIKQEKAERKTNLDDDVDENVENDSRRKITDVVDSSTSL